MKNVASERYSNKPNLLKQKLLSEVHDFTKGNKVEKGCETRGTEGSKKNNVFPTF